MLELEFVENRWVFMETRWFKDAKYTFELLEVRSTKSSPEIPDRPRSIPDRDLEDHHLGHYWVTCDSWLVSSEDVRILKWVVCQWTSPGSSRLEFDLGRSGGSNSPLGFEFADLGLDLVDLTSKSSSKVEFECASLITQDQVGKMLFHLTCVLYWLFFVNLKNK